MIQAVSYKDKKFFYLVSLIRDYDKKRDNRLSICRADKIGTDNRL